MKKLVLFCSVLLSSYSFSQIDKDYFPLERDIVKKCQGRDTNFHKTHLFFFKKQIDSSFFYSSQTYNHISEVSEIRHYLKLITLNYATNLKIRILI